MSDLWWNNICPLVNQQSAAKPKTFYLNRLYNLLSGPTGVITTLSESDSWLEQKRLLHTSLVVPRTPEWLLPSSPHPCRSPRLVKIKKLSLVLPNQIIWFNFVAVKDLGLGNKRHFDGQSPASFCSFSYFLPTTITIFTTNVKNVHPGTGTGFQTDDLQNSSHSIRE